MKPQSTDLSKGTHHVIGRQTLILSSALLLIIPQVALAQFGGGGPWEGVLQQIVDILTGNTATLVAVIAVAALGIAALFGRIPWGWGVSIIAGIAIIFGSAQIVDMFQGSVG